MEKLNKQRGLRNCNPLNIRRTADLWQDWPNDSPTRILYVQEHALGLPRGLHRVAHLLPQIWFTHGPRHHCPMGTARGR